MENCNNDISNLDDIAFEGIDLSATPVLYTIGLSDGSILTFNNFSNISITDIK